jgi:integrase
VHWNDCGGGSLPKGETVQGHGSPIRGPLRQPLRFKPLRACCARTVPALPLLLPQQHKRRPVERVFLVARPWYGRDRRGHSFGHSRVTVRRGFFEPAQFEAVRSRLPDTLQGLVIFAYITGWRVPSEVQPLQWRQVDFAAGQVRLEPGTTKNGEGRVFPFTEELRAVLEEQREYTRRVERARGIICPWVFHREGKPIVVFRKPWARACRDAGCPGMIRHDFRRTAVRNLVRAGIPERVAMTMTGHKTRSVFERYNIVSEGDLADAARKLDLAAKKLTGTVAGTVSR